METKNMLTLLPSCSPIKPHNKIEDMESTGVITMSPLMTGYTKTVKELPLLAKDENLENEEEIKEEIRINTTFSRTNHVDLLKEYYEFERD